MHISELKTQVRRRLGRLELQAAQYGINTPPEVSIQVEDLGKVLRALGTLEQQATTGAVTRTLYDKVVETCQKCGIYINSVEFGKQEDDWA